MNNLNKKILTQIIEEIFEAEEFKMKSTFKYEISKWKDKGELFEAHTFITPNSKITTGRNGKKLFNDEL